MSKKYEVEMTPFGGKQLLQIAEYICDELQAPDAAQQRRAQICHGELRCILCNHAGEYCSRNCCVPWQTRSKETAQRYEDQRNGSSIEVQKGLETVELQGLF